VAQVPAPPVGFIVLVRRHTRQLFLSDTLLQETVGMEETDDGIWAIYFYDVLLARLDERDFKLRG
jgi:hypothetical protein